MSTPFSCSSEGCEEFTTDQPGQLTRYNNSLNSALWSQSLNVQAALFCTIQFSTKYNSRPTLNVSLLIGIRVGFSAFASVRRFFFEK